MRYQDATLLDRLAAEYVLGVLHGRARRRFERVMTQTQQARAAVWRWERALMPLADGVKGVQPGKHVWREIERRITRIERRAPWYERLGLWRGLSLAATAAALVLAIMLRTASTQDQQYVAVFTDEQARPLWVVSADMERGRMSIRPMNAIAPAPDKSYELWVLPAGGAAPRSMGLLPTGGAVIDAAMPENMRAVLASAQGLAVSLEPAGGSPTGAPTGPVVHTASIVEI